MLPPIVYNPPTHTTLHILYQDDNLIALNKPSGLLSVPGRGVDKQDCMLSRVQLEFPQAQVIHRLDMSTSGLILFALTKTMQREMNKCFEKRQIHKEYIACVHGLLKDNNGIINQPLITDWNNRPKQKIDYTHGKSAKTKFSLISTHAIRNSSTVKLEPITGRSHQLRVHMSSLGHAILGDELYGTLQSRKASARLLLHARKISFTHPITHKVASINCECDF